MLEATKPKILFLDAYDSFSNNIVSLLETTLGANVTSIKIDTPIPDFDDFVQDFAALVLGPGPGDPRNSDDIGHFQRVWDLNERKLRPALGICLGFQSLVRAHGGMIQRLPTPRHGLVRTIRTSNVPLFRHTESLNSVQYHSLHAALDESVPENARALAPTAWEDFEEPSNGQFDNPQPLKRLLMAAEHKEKPFFGIQFHPESVCSSSDARQVVTNWWNAVCVWWKERSEPIPSEYSWKTPDRRRTKSSRQPLRAVDANATALRSNIPDEPRLNLTLGSPDLISKGENSPTKIAVDSPSVVNLKELDLDGLTVLAICELLHIAQGEFILLDSERHQNSELGRFSIIGLVEDDSLRFEYSAYTSELLETKKSQKSMVDLKRHNHDPFNFFEEFMDHQRFEGGHPDVPFWGGFMGYVTYEGSLQCLEKASQVAAGSFKKSEAANVIRPDLGFVFVERSIVVDHLRQKIVVQSLRTNDKAWLKLTSKALATRSSRISRPSFREHEYSSYGSKISIPSEQEYKSRIRSCKESIAAGNSYELCLTDKARVVVPQRSSAWGLYRRLRGINPAPFGSYIRLGKLSLLSSSPERFMRWSRPSLAKSFDPDHGRTIESLESAIQYRPIKGTVSRQVPPGLPPVSFDQASSILSTPKEQAENLMIVDLIRHDLHGVVGSGRVTVPKLMKVEEYATVYQLVSVIEGRMKIRKNHASTSEIVQDKQSPLQPYRTRRNSALINFSTRASEEASNKGTSPPRSPISALASTLPPGSMTGAPKLRSCQLLQSLERKPRGVYSGVIGYMDVGGGGDWSVSIRGAVRWDDDLPSQKDLPAETLGRKEDNERPDLSTQRFAPSAGEAKRLGEIWTIGAGGAVTALSTEDGEWNEMMAKMHATVKLFQ